MIRPALRRLREATKRIPVQSRQWAILGSNQ
jgi:hypothetical protein